MDIDPFRDTSDEVLHALFNAIDVPVMVVDQKLRIWHANTATEQAYGHAEAGLLKRLCGELFHCLYENRSEQRCGETSFCDDYLLRRIVLEVYRARTEFKETVPMRVLKEGEEQDIWMQVSGAPLVHKDRLYVVLTLKEATELVKLRKIIPICMHCKKIRNDKDYWIQLEEYFHEYEQMDLSHGICPDCLELRYPQYKA